MITEFVTALRAASDEDAAKALDAALQAAYTSTPRDGIAAGLATLTPTAAAPVPEVPAPAATEQIAPATEEAA